MVGVIRQTIFHEYENLARFIGKSGQKLNTLFQLFGLNKSAPVPSAAFYKFITPRNLQQNRTHKPVLKAAFVEKSQFSNAANHGGTGIDVMLTHAPRVGRFFLTIARFREVLLIRGAEKRTEQKS